MQCAWGWLGLRCKGDCSSCGSRVAIPASARSSKRQRDIFNIYAFVDAHFRFPNYNAFTLEQGGTNRNGEETQGSQTASRFLRADLQGSAQGGPIFLTRSAASWGEPGVVNLAGVNRIIKENGHLCRFGMTHGTPERVQLQFGQPTGP